MCACSSRDINGMDIAVSFEVNRTVGIVPYSLSVTLRALRYLEDTQNAARISPSVSDGRGFFPTKSSVPASLSWGKSRTCQVVDSGGGFPSSIGELGEPVPLETAIVGSGDDIVAADRG